MGSTLQTCWVETRALCIVAAAALSLAAKDKPPTPWQLVKTPAPGPARSIGEYSAGCVQGAVALPVDGEGYQVMRPKRLRHFGHPELVDYVQTLGREAHAAGLGPILVGDLSQPRGGRAPDGHASHQTGLDADLWYTFPAQAKSRALTPAERERLRPPSVIDAKAGKIRAEWRPRVVQLLELAASDARVSRVFVNPIIKRDLCASPSGERGWLEKIRPWYGHDAHFHVRLGCPKESDACTAQDPIPAGDGCGADLGWWFSEEARKDREEAREKYQAKVASGGGQPPAACEALVQDIKR